MQTSAFFSKKVTEVNIVIAEVIFFEVRELAKILASTILVIKTTTISGDESQDTEEAVVYSWWHVHHLTADGQDKRVVQKHVYSFCGLYKDCW